MPQQVQLRPGWALIVIGTTGEHPDADAEVVHDRIRADAPAPLFELCTSMPFTALQQMFDEANDWGLYVYEKGCYVADLGDPVIEVLAGQVARRVSPLSVVHLFTLDGAYSEVADDATAFGGGRSARLNAFVIGLAPDAAGLPAERVWVRSSTPLSPPTRSGPGPTSTR